MCPALHDSCIMGTGLPVYTYICSNILYLCTPSDCVIYPQPHPYHNSNNLSPVSISHCSNRPDSALALCDNDWNDTNDFDCNDSNDNVGAIITAYGETENEKFPSLDPETVSIGYYSRPNSRSSAYRNNEGKVSVADTRSPLLSERHTILETEVNQFIEDGIHVNGNLKSSSREIELESSHSKSDKTFDTNGNSNKTIIVENIIEFGQLTDTKIEKSFKIEDYDILSSKDIEIKMAETKVKMNDAMLSNGRDELAVHNRKLRHYLRQREHLKEGVTVATTMKQSPDIAETNKNNNNNNPIRPQTLAKSVNKKIIQTPSDMRNSTRKFPKLDGAIVSNIRDVPHMESPIVDAYEKECLDVPEKIVKEMEKKLLARDKNTSSSNENIDETEKDNSSGIESGFILCASNNLEANKENKEPSGKLFSGKSIYFSYEKNLNLVKYRKIS